MYDESIKVNSTGHILLVTLRNSTTGQGATGVLYSIVTGYYSVDGGAATLLSLIAGSAGDSYSSGKWAELSSSDMPGDYALHMPDAVVATGTRAVISLRAPNVIDTKIKIKIVAHDVKDANALGLSRIDAAISSRSSHTAADVWSSVTRTLTSGVNIRLTKDSELIGFNDLSASDIRSAVGLASANLDTQLANVIATGMIYWTGGGTTGGSLTASDVWTYATRTLTSPLNLVSGIADAVWDEPLGDHLTGGSTGAGLNSASSAGDPWNTSLPGAYSAGTAGHIVGNYLNYSVSGLAVTLGSSGAGLTSIPWNASWDTQVESEVSDALIAYDPPTKAELDTSVSVIIATGTSQWRTATGFSTHTAADIWSVATRLLTAGTNISLTKGVGILGFNDLDMNGIASGVWGANRTNFAVNGTFGQGISSVTGSIGSLSTNAQGNIRTAIGLASANIDTQFANVIATGMIYWTGGGGASITASDIWSYNDRTLTSPINLVSGIADAVWDELIADHLTVGSVGASLNSAGSAGDPWNTTLPGAYAVGTAGHIIGNYLNYSVSGIASNIGSAGANLTSIPWNSNWNTEVSGIINSNGVITMSTIYDGSITIQKFIRAAGAWMQGKLSVVDAGSNNYTMTYKGEDDSTNVLIVTASSLDGSRSSGGSIL